MTQDGDRPRGRWPSGHKRPQNTSPERDAAIVRGVLSQRLDDALDGLVEEARAALAPFLEPFEVDRVCERVALDWLQRVQVLLFPELYGREEGVGLVPESGGKGVGADRLRAFAAMVTGRAG